MNTNKIDLIKAEVEKLKSQLLRGACSSQIAMETMCKEEAYNEVLALLDTMQEEPVSKVWHDASEEPKEGFTIVVYMKDDSLKVLTSWGENGDFCIGEGFWYNIHQQRKWAYVDDLLKM